MQHDYFQMQIKMHGYWSFKLKLSSKFVIFKKEKKWISLTHIVTNWFWSIGMGILSHTEFITNSSIQQHFVCCCWLFVRFVEKVCMKMDSIFTCVQLWPSLKRAIYDIILLTVGCLLPARLLHRRAKWTHSFKAATWCFFHGISCNSNSHHKRNKTSD